MGTVLKKIVLALLAALFFVGFLEGVARCVLYRRSGRHAYALSQWAVELKTRMAQPRGNAAAPGGDSEWNAYLQSPQEIRRLIPEFLQQQVAFGNTPFKKLKTDETTSVFRDAAGHLCNKPDAVYDLYFLRSRIYDPFDPIVYKAYPDRAPSGAVLAFRERYALAPKRNTIDAWGDRLTLPESTASNVILVLGDSVAFGAGVADAETLASQLQARYPAWRFVNAGVSGCNARDNLARLDQRIQRFGANLKGVIYVHCENDFDARRGDDPSRIVAALADRLDTAGISRRILVYSVFIYRAMPDLFRDRPAAETRQYYRLKNEMLAAARARGFATVDGYELVERYRKEQGTPLAGLHLFVDHCHYSAAGAARVAEAIPDLAVPAP